MYQRTFMSLCSSLFLFIAKWVVVAEHFRKCGSIITHFFLWETMRTSGENKQKTKPDEEQTREEWEIDPKMTWLPWSKSNGKATSVTLQSRLPSLLVTLFGSPPAKMCTGRGHFATETTAIYVYFLFNISFRFSSRSLYIQMCVVTIFKMTLRINKKYMGIFLYVFKKRKPWHGQLHTPVWSARFYPRFPWLQKWIRVLGKNKNFWRNSYGYNACGRGKMMSIGWLIGARQISLSYSPWLLNN